MTSRQSKRRKVSEDGQSSTGPGSNSNNVMEVAKVPKWTPTKVVDLLTSNGYENEAKLFEELNIFGKCPESLTEDLPEGEDCVRILAKRLEILKEFKKMTNPRNNQNLKVFNDPIHGHVSIPQLCVRIIDTEQFQRLRYIKQMGCGYLVYPGAAHNRFEHSLGVCHLAGTFCRTLQQRQPELEITEEDVLCVQIAGLCHDLGHGPFSHTFEDFIKAIDESSSWTHEKASLDMLDHLIQINQLEDDFKQFRLNEKDITFIKELIFGPLHKKEGEEKVEEWPYSGRSKDKSFLYEIVANKHSGIDVDKWDYFLRDCHNLGLTASFDCHRYMKFSRVIEVNGVRQICARDKEQLNLYDMFYTRNILHQRACQHKVKRCTEHMIIEALKAANDHYSIKGHDGKKISDAIDDMVAYTKLTDDIILEIMRSSDSNLKKSQDILKSVQKRQLYTFLGEARPKGDLDLEKKSIPGWKTDIVSALDPDDTPALEVGHLFIDLVSFSYGKKKDDPINSVHFYSKMKPDEAFKIESEGQMLPKRFAEQVIRFYCTSREQKHKEQATKCVKKWCAIKEFKYKAADVSDLEPSTDKTPATPPRSSKDSTDRAPERPSKDNTPTTPVKKTPRKLDFE